MIKKTFQAIDFMKFILAIAIVAIHTHGLQQFYSVAEYWYLERLFLRLGVPFFFIASGFFIGKKISANPSEIKQIVINYIKRLAVPLFVFQGINIIIRFILDGLNGQSFTMSTILAVRSVLFYPYGALWYMQASIVAIALLYYFIKNHKVVTALAVGSLLYLVGLLANSYYFLIENTQIVRIVDMYLKVFVSSRNGVFVGFIFLGIGIWLSKKYATTDFKKFRRCSITAFIISAFLSILEVANLYGNNFADSGDYYIMLLLLAPSLFALLLTVKVTTNDNLAKLSRKLSIGLYLLHAPVRDTTKIIAHLNKIEITNLYLFLVTLVVCFIILAIVYYFKPKTIYKLLS